MRKDIEGYFLNPPPGSAAERAAYLLIRDKLRICSDYNSDIRIDPPIK